MNGPAAIEFFRRSLGYRFPRLGRTAFDLFFRIGPKKVRTEIVPNIFANLDLSDEVQRATYWQGERFEQPTLELLRQWAAEGATHFFDIGSNYGFFTFALLSAHPHLLAHAFEPNPDTFAHLREIVNENKLDRAATWNLGLSNACARLPFHRGINDSGHSTFGSHPDLPTTDVIDVLDFETWRARANVPLPNPRSWIAKIDVEGYEMRVLTGLRPALEAGAFRGLAVEVNRFTLEFCGSEPEEIYSFMDSLGFAALARSSKRQPPFDGNEFFLLR